NNDPQTLHFVAVSSTDRDQTAQPWLVWGATPGSFTTTGNPANLHFVLPGLFSTEPVTVRNLGTGPLRFKEGASSRLGAPNSPAVITKMLVPVEDGDTTRQLDSHGVKDIVFGVHNNGADTDVTVTHTMGTNDPNPAHEVDLTIDIRRTNFPPPPLGGPCHQ